MTSTNGSAQAAGLDGAGVALAASEIGLKITPDPSPSLESTFAAQLDAIVRRACQIARALVGAEQAAIQLWVTDPSRAHKYFTLSEKYAAFHSFRVDPKGTGLHGMTIPGGEVVRLTQPEVLAHPLFRGFAPFADVHPPLRGWLATSVCGDDGRPYGLLQLSDKRGGCDFDEADEADILHLAALLGAALDALRLAAGGACLDPLARPHQLAPSD